MRPERLWWWSVCAYRRRWFALARLLKALNFALNKVSLPAQVDLAEPITLWHRGLGTVIHPSTRIGKGVRIAHGVTVSAGDWHELTEFGVVIEDDVTLTTGCSVIPRAGHGLTIGRGAVIGAHALITEDVPANALMVSPKAIGVTKRTAPKPR